jgi:hypothetical protein
MSTPDELAGSLVAKAATRRTSIAVGQIGARLLLVWRSRIEKRGNVAVLD